MTRYFKRYVVLLLLFIVIGVLVYNKRRPREYFHYQGELFADQAGYYVYLPGFFIYELDGSGLSEELIEKKLGSGFRVDSTTGYLTTKYPVGVAIMQAPFFLITHMYNHAVGNKTDGFTGNYHNVPNWASWFYSSVGLWFLYLFLQRRIDTRLAILMLMVVYFGTSTYYYSADNTGMSHVYSFFLFNSLIYFLDSVCAHRLRVKSSVLIGLICGLIVVVRPINILMVPLVVWYVCVLRDRRFEWVKSQLNLKAVAVMALAMGLTILPQLMYWKYTSGSWVYYSYSEEGFVNWAKPEIVPFLFSPLSGLFVYSPAYFVAVLAMLVGYKKRGNGLLAVGFFLFCYLMASWHQYYFGCSFGSRNLVDFSGLFFIPLTLRLDAISALKSKVVGVLLMLSCLYTMNLVISYKGCYDATKWNWNEYVNMVERGAYYKSIKNKEIGPEDMYVGISTFNSNSYTVQQFKWVDVHVNAKGFGPKTELAFEVNKGGIIQYATVNLAKESERDNGEVFYKFVISEDCPMDAVFKVYLMNLGGDDIEVEEMEMWMH